MKLIIDEITGNERSETRTEILARHSRMTLDHASSMSFLDEIKRECFDTETIELDALTECNEYRQDQSDKGLVSLINTSKDLMPVDDVVERCSAILARHNGYKGGVFRTEDRQGYRDQLQKREQADELAE